MGNTFVVVGFQSRRAGVASARVSSLGRRLRSIGNPLRRSGLVSFAVTRVDNGRAALVRAARDRQFGSAGFPANKKVSSEGTVSNFVCRPTLAQSRAIRGATLAILVILKITALLALAH